MEFVLVVPRRALFPEHYPQGMARLTASNLNNFRQVIDEHGFFVERERAEREPEWKQVIPYVAIAQGDVHPERLFVMRRLKSGGEARLHGKRSIGVGGHINPEDARPGEPRSKAVLRGALREISEEVHILGDSGQVAELQPIGLINDDATAVGAVHVGLACVLRTSSEVLVREEEILEGRLIEPSEIARLREDGADFETWSSFLLDALFPTDSGDSRTGAAGAACGDAFDASTAWSLDSLTPAGAAT